MCRLAVRRDVLVRVWKETIARGDRDTVRIRYSPAASGEAVSRWTVAVRMEWQEVETDDTERCSNVVKTFNLWDV